MKKHQTMQNRLLRRSESRVPGKPVWKRVVQSEKVAKKTRLIDDSRFAVAFVVQIASRIIRHEGGRTIETSMSVARVGTVMVNCLSFPCAIPCW